LGSEWAWAWSRSGGGGACPFSEILHILEDAKILSGDLVFGRMENRPFESDEFYISEGEIAGSEKSS
jgi:hypothetical protein